MIANSNIEAKDIEFMMDQIRAASVKELEDSAIQNNLPKVLEQIRKASEEGLSCALIYHHLKHEQQLAVLVDSLKKMGFIVCDTDYRDRFRVIWGPSKISRIQNNRFAFMITLFSISAFWSWINVGPSLLIKIGITLMVAIFGIWFTFIEPSKEIKRRNNV